MENLKDKIHHVWVNVLLKCKILLPYGSNGGARINTKNPFAYIVIFITMFINWVWSVFYAIVVSVFEGLYALIAVYINTIKKAFELRDVEKLNAAREALKKSMAEKGHTAMPNAEMKVRKPAPTKRN